MNTKTGIAMIALVFGIALSPILANEAQAKTFAPLVLLQGDLTSPSNDKPFGGDKIGSYIVGVYDAGKRGGQTTISIELDNKAKHGTVYEGWLVDTDSGEKTSFGRFPENPQRQAQFYTVSVPSTFDNELIVITEEPIVDTDPAPARPIGGAELGRPYGQ